MPKVKLGVDSYDQVDDDGNRTSYARGDEVEVTKAEAERLESLGAVDSGDADDESADDLDGLKKDELEAVAAAEGVDISGAKSNADRAEAIRAARG